MCYIYHLLNLNPDALAKVRQEHDDVFGQETSSTAEVSEDKSTIIK
jgi:hypothetical protein